eukprot:jgi/Mesen1/10022/ME000073S09301
MAKKKLKSKKQLKDQEEHTIEAEEQRGDDELAADCVVEERDLYEVLGVEKSASPAEIRKAYHRMALSLHPDKNPGDESAKDKFQTLQRIFGVLSDPEKRAIYDRTGSIEDSELAGQKFGDLYDYYRAMFNQVTEHDIEQFEVEYRGSAEEAQDLKRHYTRFQGDMRKVMAWVMCSRDDLDSHRFMDILDAAIQAGEVEASKKYKKWAADVAKRPPSGHDPLAVTESDKKAKKKDVAQNGDLMALIKGRQKERSEDLFASLEAKYAGKDKRGREKKSKRKADAQEHEPSEEEFQAAKKQAFKK